MSWTQAVRLAHHVRPACWPWCVRRANLHLTRGSASHTSPTPKAPLRVTHKFSVLSFSCALDMCDYATNVILGLAQLVREVQIRVFYKYPLTCRIHGQFFNFNLSCTLIFEYLRAPYLHFHIH